MIEETTLQTLSNTASQSTIRLLPLRSDYALLKRRDLYACIGVFLSFFIAGTLQFQIILEIPLSPKSFTMPFVMASLISLGMVRFRIEQRRLAHERDQHEFVRAQVQMLNQRLKEHLSERTELLLSAREQVALAQARADLGVMASGVVHDINNALMTISMSWELFKDTPSSLTSERDELSKSLDYALQQVQEITQDFKLFLRADQRSITELGKHLDRLHSFLIRSMESQQKLSLYWRPGLEGSESHNHAYDQWGSVLNEGRQSSHISEAPQLYVPLSEGQLTQVVMNLIVNARDALRNDPGEVVVELSTVGEEVLIRVSDNGSGMSDEVRSRIFEPFYTTKSEGRGTGLGLHVIYQLVHRVKGRIEVESELGLGTRFTIRLPLVSEFSS